jgi:SET domain
VLTMADIPLGAFVCEIAGQYVDADSLSISAKVRQRLMGANSAEGAPTLNDCLDNHIIPLSLWEAGASEGCVSGYGIHGSSSSSASLLGSKESTAILIDDGAAENTVINLDADSEESQAIEGDYREPEARHAAPMDACSNTNTNTEEPPDFFKGLICIDCNKFGNVGRFIRHRPKERKMTKSATASTSPSSQPMLIRRLIYTNAQDRRYPKVALFAARKISANTELLI